MSNPKYFAMITDRMFQHISKGGHRVNLEVPNLLADIIRTEAWKHGTDPETGKPYKDIGTWLCRSFPNGAGVGQFNHFLKFEQLVDICREHYPDVAEVLNGNRPDFRKKENRNAPEEAKKAFNNRAQSGNRKEYLLRRLAEQRPDLYEKVQAGELTASAAAIKAGWRKKQITVNVDNVDVAVGALLNHFTVEDIRASLRKAKAKSKSKSKSK